MARTTGSRHGANSYGNPQRRQWTAFTRAVTALLPPVPTLAESVIDDTWQNQG
jgi:hypothetical protein